MVTCSAEGCSNEVKKRGRIYCSRECTRIALKKQRQAMWNKPKREGPWIEELGDIIKD